MGPNMNRDEGVYNPSHEYDPVVAMEISNTNISGTKSKGKNFCRLASGSQQHLSWRSWLSSQGTCWQNSNFFTGFAFMLAPTWNHMHCMRVLANMLQACLNCGLNVGWQWHYHQIQHTTRFKHIAMEGFQTCVTESSNKISLVQEACVR